MEFKTFIILLVIGSLVYVYVAPQYDWPLPEQVEELLDYDQPKIINDTVEEVRNVTTEIVSSGIEVVLVNKMEQKSCDLANPLMPVDLDNLGFSCESIGGSWFVNSSVISCSGGEITSIACYSSIALQLESICAEEGGVWECGDEMIRCQC